MVDFPRHLAAVVFVQGCNFRCGYCHNPDIVTLDKDFGCDASSILAEIERQKTRIEGVVITGGEPAISPEIIGFIEKIKDMELLVKLDTNGSNPSLLLELFRRHLLDYVAMDLKTSLDKYHLVTSVAGIAAAIEESVRWLLLSTVPYEFRTTCVPGIVDESDFSKIAGLVKGAKKYCLQQFSPAVTFDPSFRDITPYDKAQLERFADILRPAVEVVEIRGL